MRIDHILHRQFAHDLVGIHLARIRLVFAATSALLRGGRISLTSIGRAIAGRTTHKHGIKRVDRLLGNEAIWTQRVSFFRAIARRVIAPCTRPIVIVDWTSFTASSWSLVAAVSFEGRAIVIYSETHPVSGYLKPAINRSFLRRLSEVLPEQCVPIVIADAGFRSPWMTEVTRLGWDYICRLRGLARLRKVGTLGWRPLLGFFLDTRRRAKDFGQHEIGLQVHFQTRVIGFSKRGPSHWEERWGAVPKGRVNKALRSAKEPWILATSLSASAKKVAVLYGRRMQIEETFRDTKSNRLGMSMKHARTRSLKRAEILTLLASLAHLASIIVGLAAEALRLDRGYQANTLRRRRVLSLSRLGQLVVFSEKLSHLNDKSTRAAWNELFERARSSCDPLN